MMAADDTAPELAVPEEDAIDQQLVDIPEPFTGDFPIRVKGLRNAFGDQVIHDGLDLEVRRGEIIGVVGGSGTGKSVLMRSIIGLQIPEAGTIEVLGRSITDARDDDDIDIRSRWGVLFQGGALFSTLTVGENVEVPLKEFYPEINDELTRSRATRCCCRACQRRPPRAIRRNCRAGCASAPGWRARCRSIPNCCSSMNRPPGLIRSAPPRSIR